MGGMAALGVASSRGSGSHSRCKLPRHSELAGSWLSVSQTHLVAVLFFFFWFGLREPSRAAVWLLAQHEVALHWGLWLCRVCTAPVSRAGVQALCKNCFAPAKTSKMGAQHQGPQHHSPGVTLGSGGEVFVFFPAVVKLGL